MVSTAFSLKLSENYKWVEKDNISKLSDENISKRTVHNLTENQDACFRPVSFDR